jgi:hypothetical protein
MEFLGMLDGDVVAFALFGEDMEHDRLVAGLGVFEDSIRSGRSWPSIGPT